MRVYRLQVRRFRGFRDVTIAPKSHVLLVGEPRAGRSTVVEALRRVLSPAATRMPLLDDLDFYGRDTSRSIQIEVVLGALGNILEQEFFDQLELWDDEAREVVRESPDPTLLDTEDTKFVLRLCYRAFWNEAEERADHWVDFPKLSDTATESYARVPRRQLDLLPVVFVDQSSRPLNFGARSEFRRLVERADGDDFSVALENLMDSVETAADAFTESDQVAAALDDVMGPLDTPVFQDRWQSDRVRFVPEGGSLAGILRSLEPSLRLSRSLWLPLGRHGSTVAEMLRSAEALAAGVMQQAVCVVDDFGEGVDVAAAAHLSATYRSAFAQVWLSTRRGQSGDAFPADEIVRLTRPRRGIGRVHQRASPRTRADRVAARHLAVQLLSAISSRTLAVLEGPHDRAGLTAVALRRLDVAGEPLPAASGISLVDAGAVDRSGGAVAAAKLATFARELGFRVVVILDGDRAGDDAEADAIAGSDAVVRLPTGAAIERVLVDGIARDDLLEALRGLQHSFSATLPANIETLEPVQLRGAACDAIKSKGGLHAQFVELLPQGIVPPLAARLLDTLMEAAHGRIDGVVTL